MKMTRTFKTQTRHRDYAIPMLDSKRLPSWSLLLAVLVVAAPACIASDDDDDDDEPNQDGTGGSATGGSGEAGAPASGAGAPAGGSSEPGESGGSGAGEAGTPTAGTDGESGGAAPVPSDGGSTSGGADPGEPAQAGSGGAVEGGGGAPPTPTGGTSGVPEKWGVVILSQTEQLYPAPINLLRASGAVARFGLTSGGGSCDTVELGACQLYTGCTSGTEPPSEGLHAGTVTITGLDDDLPLPYDATLKSYMSAAIPSFLWTSSQSATVTVEGSAEVPGYEMDLALPNPIEVTAPLADGDSTYTIAKGSDLNVTWIGGVEGFVTVSLGSSEEDGAQISCVVDASEGEVSVPEAFLSMLGETGTFSAGVTNVTVETVEDWTMQFQASTLKDAGTATFSE